LPFIDTEAPIVKITSPINAECYNSALLWLDIDYIGMGVAINDIWYNWNGNDVTYWSAVNIVFNEGVNTINVWAKDSAGNVGFKSITFTVDTTDPLIEILSPIDDKSYYGITQLLEISASDPTTEIDTIVYNWEGSNETYSTPEEIPFNVGYNTLNVWANDSAGRISMDTATFLITSGNFFTSVWNTSKTCDGSTNENRVKLPLDGIAGSSFLFIVDWGDGSNNTIAGEDALHTYATPGVYTINITGTIIGWSFNLGGDRLKILEIKHWGDLRLGNTGTAAYFFGCENLIITADDVLDITGTPLMYYAFTDCFSMATINNLEQWDVSHVTNMDCMFAGAINFNQDIGNWNVSSVTRMDGMLASTSFNQDLSEWDVSQVTDMSGMFGGTPFNTDISSWDVSKVVDMSGMFSYASNFNQDISNWNNSRVTTMSGMFRSASSFNQNIGNWDVSHVTNMRYMFYQCGSFNQNLDQWNVSQVTDMYSMLCYAYAFKGNISTWNITKVTNVFTMLGDVTLPTEIYSDLLVYWASLPLIHGLTFHATYCKYSAGAAATARAYIISTFGWTISDGGLAP
jgi:surface protein